MNTLQKISILSVFLAGLWIGLVPRILLHDLHACESLTIAPAFDSSPMGRCYITRLTGIVKTYGMRMTVEVLQQYLRTPQGNLLAGQRCHALAHEIGNAAVRAGTPSHQLLTQCIAMCTPTGVSQSIKGLNLGCLNGAGHTWVLLDRDVRVAAAKCSDPKVSQEAQGGCFHGIGHGLSELYAGNIEIELMECRKLPEGQAQYQCAHAVFMEKQSLLTRDTIPQDPLTYCEGLPLDMRASCFEFIGYMVFTRSQHAPVALSACQKIPETMGNVCRERVGESIYLTRGNPEDVTACLVGKIHGEKDCLNGFFRTSIDNVNDFFGNLARQSCEFLSGENRTYCYDYLEELVKIRYGK